MACDQQLKTHLNMAYNEFSDELLAAVVPFIVYWIFTGIYEVVAYLFPDSRLHTKEEEDAKNIVSRWTVLKAVLTQQTGQMLFVFLVIKMTGKGEGIARPQPSFLLAAWHFFVAMVILDAWEYSCHRFFHANKFFHKHIHSVHHKLIVPYSYGSMYGHWLDTFLMDTVGGVLAAVISGMTPRTSIYFFSFANAKGADLHSELWLPWSPFQMLFANNPAYHDTHHQLRGYHCNYAQPFFIAWDKIFGTYRPFEVIEKKGGGYQVKLI